MDILPLAEMYLRWDLQEDVCDLHSLMELLKCEDELHSHEFGQSFLLMIASDVGGIKGPSNRIRVAMLIDCFLEMRQRPHVANNVLIEYQVTTV